MSASLLTNRERAAAAWGIDMPAWVRLLASACDATNQRAAGGRIGRDSSYISRVLRKTYAGSYEEAELLVRAAFGAEDVVCPVWGAIKLETCIRNRRHPGPPRNQMQHLNAANCPLCPNNTDRPDAGEEA